MKQKLVAFLTATAMILSLTACGNAENSNSDDRVKGLEAEKEAIQQPGEQNSEKEQPSADSEEERLLKEAAGIDDSNAEDWGVCGADLTWYYDNNILLMRGTGDMSDNPIRDTGDMSDNSWQEYSEDINWVIIEDGCAGISDSAFGEGYNTKCLRNLSKVRLPDTLITIGEYAFYNCENLTSITIPDSVTTIGNGAFSGTGITSITIPDSVTYLSGFSDTAISSIDIPDSVTEIGGGAFEGCKNITSITIPDSVTKINSNAFAGTGITSITIPDSVTYLSGLGSTAISGITIPDSVTIIGVSAFRNCKNLTSVAIPDGVTTIDYQAFAGCDNLTSVTIPDSVTYIDHYAFSGCRNLTSVTIPNADVVIYPSAFDDGTKVTIGGIEITWDTGHGWND